MFRKADFGKSVTLRLRKGSDPNDLETVLTIVCMCYTPPVGAGWVWDGRKRAGWGGGGGEEDGGGGKEDGGGRKGGETEDKANGKRSRHGQ